MGEKNILVEWHKRVPGSVLWRLTPDGVEVRGEGHPRTSGKPATMAMFAKTHEAALFRASKKHGMPVELILATLGAEGGPNLIMVRHEPGYAVDLVQGVPAGTTTWLLNRLWRDIPVASFKLADERTPDRVSVGVMHTLISTARQMVGPKADRAWLMDPANSIEAGAAYIAHQKKLTGWDPPVVGAAYNAGGVYPNDSPGNRWKMRMYPIGTSAHVDRWVAWYNDAVEVVKTSSKGKFPHVHADLIS